MKKYNPVVSKIPKYSSLNEFNKEMANHFFNNSNNDKNPVNGIGFNKTDIMIINDLPKSSELEKGAQILTKEKALLLRNFKNNNKNYYFTYAVKQRVEKITNNQVRPKGSEINIWKPWLMQEIELVKPKIIILCGTISAQSVLGKLVNIKESLFIPFKYREYVCFVYYSLQDIHKKKSLNIDHHNIFTNYLLNLNG